MEVSLRFAATLLQQAKRVVLTGHVSPDGDCLGSMLALYHCLVSMGLQAHLILDDDIPFSYQFLPGIEFVKKPDTPLEADLLVVLDASDERRIGRVKSMVDAPVLNLDHHISNVKFADYYYLDFQAAATGEIILQLLQAMQVEISRDIAVCLYTAIATDCGFFRYANTSAATMRNAAYLLECGAEPHTVSEQLDAKPLASILALKRVLDTLEIFHDGKTAAITLTADILAGIDNTDGFVNYPRNIAGVEVAAMFKVAGEDTIKVSLRSKQVDVSQLALSFGGGGHKRAAGFTLNGPIDEVKKTVMQAILQLENG